MRTAAQRLNDYRSKAAGRTDHYGNWRAWMPSRPVQIGGINRSQEDPNVVFVDSLEALGWRQVGDAHKLVNLRHTGWYTSEDQGCGGLLVGTVLLLPHNRRIGCPQFVPATYSTEWEWDTVTVYLGDICDDQKDAAYRADRLAELAAEKEREWRAKDEVQQRIADNKAEYHESAAEVKKLIHELRSTELSEFVKGVLISTLRDRLRERSTLLEENAKLASDPWSIYS